MNRLIIANRGEIACRILRSAKARGLHTIAVYSQEDRNALHVKLADEAVAIGPAEAAQSYLNIERIIEAALSTDADAVHPGYGFLSENEEFAAAVTKVGLIFVGPSPEAIRIMGNKAEAKKRMIDAGVPCVPGYQGAGQDDDTLKQEAEKIGYPVMVKAAAGGGGRGMRVVDKPEHFEDAVAIARSEAAASFGSDELILEKAVQNARHVEFQIFADSEGNTVHLGERDCSVQRRHQKIIEEAPCPVMDEKLRAEMGNAAVEAAKAINYVGAGTVEFLLDPSGQFYFLEMNTRLQVEHPVTEMITGLDLVDLQLDVASGKPLPFSQDDVKIDGHAIEARLYAEDPSIGFLPSTGKIERLSLPREEIARVDSGVTEGDAISPHYDPMIAKIVAWGEDRETARRKLVRALSETKLLGPRTNRDFLLAVVEQERFQSGAADTGFLEQMLPDGQFSIETPDIATTAIAAILLHRELCQRMHAKAYDVSRTLLDWSSQGISVSHISLSDTDNRRNVTLSSSGGNIEAVCNGEKIDLSLRLEGSGKAAFNIDGHDIRVDYVVTGDEVQFATAKQTFCFRNAGSDSAKAKEAQAQGSILAPMHGLLTSVSVEAGQSVKTGEVVAVLEAMKMQHQLVAAIDGTVKSVQVAVGEQASAGQIVMEIEPAKEEETS